MSLGQAMSVLGILGFIIVKFPVGIALGIGAVRLAQK